MDIFVPSYYENFKCIAGKCRHNCCIGWEIDIDDQSLVFYEQQSYIAKNIDFCDMPHFVLGESERCPFLNKDNLCDIYLNYGEDKLCQICRDHPRFVNEYNSREEIGLGLTCEAAVKLILENDFRLKKLESNNTFAIADAEEEDFFEYREELFKTDVKELKHLLPNCDFNELFLLFDGLERLDNSWDKLLRTLQDKKGKLADLEIKDNDIANRLFCYFLFRHLYNYGLEFCVFCTYFILSLGKDIYENARMFSSEIEYSDENIEKIIEALNLKDF